MGGGGHDTPVVLFWQALRGFPLTRSSPPVMDSQELDAYLTALDWARRNRTSGHRGAALALPPAESMDFLVGKGVEVLWPAEGAWYKGIVQSYSQQTGKHFLLYVDGDVEWAPLNSGYFSWQLLSAEVEASVRAQIAQSERKQIQLMPGLPLGFTTDGPRLYGPAPACGLCRQIEITPGALLSCGRCGEGFHARCLDAPPDLEAVGRGCWVCDACAKCDGCGATTSSEIRMLWPPKVRTPR